ncbi:unnamed protein product [Blepharisma stoltei]|uniref:Uncharacterized protein n=1 Tax=Blepharisma stoltei TaxID=1481888 RepID=A0AAU9IWZ4_9CILI|nr:unnamed protein product [Blepharisma stoltei]
MDQESNFSDENSDDGILSIAADNSSTGTISRAPTCHQVVYNKYESVGTLVEIWPHPQLHMSIASEQAEEAYRAHGCICTVF